MLRWSAHTVKEGEVVGAVHGGRAGLQWSAVFSELAEGQRADADLDDLEPFSVVRLREDNAACELALKRGYSAAMSYISKIMQPVVLFARRILARYVDGQFEF